ncbi:hypothetical protein BpHYR1_035886 [Brachionus plicatilis]|uniref:Uncharacterized protein n=1 Tax=Brachionus plicatilis TaxID=10195 RepID=A0A3M7QUS0_BRAPC|nr:hypothetical protein BpHYR1_035886 [Brachionus plicatilis]
MVQYGNLDISLTKRIHEAKFICSVENFNDIDNFLEKYGLFAFQHRILHRMLSFTLFFHESPENLRTKLKKNGSRNLKYNLRSSDNLIEPLSKTANGEKTFEYFYTRLMNSCVIKRSIICKK